MGKSRILLGWALIVLVGCGGEAESPAPMDESTGGEEALADGTEPIAEPGAETAAEPGPSGPATLRVAIKLGTESTDLPFQVLDANGETVAEGRPGMTLQLAPGAYALRATVDDPNLLIDRYTATGDRFTLGAGETREEELTIGVSRVRLKVLRRGRPVSRGQIELRRQGSDEVVASFPIGDEHISISPGRYEGVVTIGNSKVEVTGLVFQGGATQVIPVRMD